MPDVTGKSLAAAKQALRRAELRVGKVSRSYSSSIAMGEVIRTKPPAGDKLTVDSSVDIIRSAGVQVPSVVGEPLAAATETLESKGFTVEVSDERYHPDVPAGVVIAQSPSSGGAAAGSTAQLTVSQGPKPVPVPNVEGKSVQKAVKILENAGFEVRVTNGPFPGNTVRAQRPEAGDKAQPGTEVAIFAW